MRSHWLYSLSAAALATAIFAVDTFTTLEIAVAVLYVAVVLMSVNFSDRRGIVSISLTCMGLTLISFLIAHNHDFDDASIGKLIVALCANAITTFLAVRIQAATTSLIEQAQLLELTHDAIFVRDFQDVVIYWNRGAEELYGWSKDQVLGRRFSDLALKDIAHERENNVAQLLRTGRWEGELLYRRRDGSLCVVASRWSLQCDDRDRPIGILETDTDITNAKKAEDNIAKLRNELAHAARVATLGELTASIAHEVNQPLAGIVTNGEACLRWLGRATPDLAEVESAVKRMIGDGRRASDVIKRLRALARKSDTDKTPLNVNEVIEDAISIVQREMARTDVTVRMVLASGLPEIIGDRVQLQQVAINMVVNAIQAMSGVSHRPRELTIWTRSEQDEVIVDVEDVGPGIAIETESQLFNAFFTTKEQGMGMGLSICRTIIEAHCGRLWFSKNPAFGVTFHFAVPRAKGDPL
jgi:two-component system, LuxR family, sensor kinase FixL